MSFYMNSVTLISTCLIIIKIIIISNQHLIFIHANLSVDTDSPCDCTDETIRCESSR